MSGVYVDSSALLKRVIIEAESDALRSVLTDRARAEDLLTASSLAWLELWRALRRTETKDVGAQVDRAVSGVAEFPLDATVLDRARRVGQDGLRSLDAIHLASALAVGTTEMISYDDRLAEAAAGVGIDVLMPGR